MRSAIHSSIAIAMLILGAGMADDAEAQTSGIEKCSLDGYVMTYYPALDMWQKSTIDRCDARGSSSREDRNESSDRNRRREDSRRNGSDRDNENSSGQPIDGDEKCGPDGYILKYRYSDYSKKGSWSSTFRRCSR